LLRTSYIQPISAEYLIGLANIDVKYVENFDYRNIPVETRDELFKLFGNKYADDIISICTKGKLIQKAKFVTDKSLVYESKIGVYVRGTLYFKYGAGTSKDVMWEGCTEYDKWYQIDIEYEFGYAAGDGNLGTDSAWRMILNSKLNKAVPLYDNVTLD
jgi:hypothetical protein